MARDNKYNLVIVILICVYLGLFVYGFLKYPHAPIRFVENKFVDKKHNEYTREQYEYFKIWEKCLAGSFVFMFGGPFLIRGIEKYKSGRK